MFGSLFGKKKVEIFAPVTGQVLDITKVGDEVFAQKILGDGFGVEPTGGEITAPCAGEIIQVADTRHAVMLETEEGVQLLIHIGLDTVELKGQGFTAHVEEGQKVQQGAKLVTVDAELVKSQGKPLTTIVVVANADDCVKKMTKALSGTGPVLTLELQ